MEAARQRGDGLWEMCVGREGKNIALVIGKGGKEITA